MSETIPEAPLPLFCANCGCPRQVRTTALVQDPDPAAKTRYTYLRTACPACGSETEYLVFLESGWTVQNGDQQRITCPCGGTLFRDPDRDAPAERIERGTLVAYHDLTCSACGRESVAFIFAGSEVLTDLERSDLLAGGSMTYRPGGDDWFRRMRMQEAGEPQRTPPPAKPLGGKAYGSIPHLPGSKFGDRRDRGVPEGEDRLYLDRPHPGDRVVVMEKLDGSCVAALKKDGEILPLIRNGYPAAGSVWRQHRMFARWVRAKADAFAACLGDGDRVVGEWLAQAHGTRYDLAGRQPFVVFDYFRGDRRLPALEAEARVQAHGLAFVPVLAAGPEGLPVADALLLLGEHGHYGALDPAEGVVYRRETPDGRVYLAKYVRPEAEPGRYLPGDDDPDKAVWNWPPGGP